MALYSQGLFPPQDKLRLFPSMYVLCMGIRPKKHLGELVLDYLRTFRGSLTPEVPERYAKIQSELKTQNVLFEQIIMAEAGVEE